MTRRDFLSDLDTWWELLGFCSDESCPVCYNVYCDDDRDEFLNSELTDMARDNNWYELRDILNDLPTGYEYYRRDDYGDWYGLDSGDFEDYKSDVLAWGDDHDIWDPDESETEEESSDEEEPEDDAYVAGSVDELFAIGAEYAAMKSPKPEERTPSIEFLFA